jgi:hypothetical protein
MKLWFISQGVDLGGYVYDSAVVAAETEEDARFTHPAGKRAIGKYQWSGSEWGVVTWGGAQLTYEGTALWVRPEDVKVRCIGETNEPAGVVLASFDTY